MLFNRLKTQSWEILIPESWQEGDGGSSSLFFCPDDGTKGLYIASWLFQPEKVEENSDLSERFIEVDRKSFAKMDSYNWELQEYKREDLADQSIGVIDYYDPAKSYRIACKVVARFPVVVRVAYHDYECKDLEGSRALSDDILGSLVVGNESA